MWKPVYTYIATSNSLGSLSLGLGDSEGGCCPVAVVTVPSGVGLQPPRVVADLVLAWGIRSLGVGVWVWMWGWVRECGTLNGFWYIVNMPVCLCPPPPPQLIYHSIELRERPIQSADMLQSCVHCMDPKTWLHHYMHLLPTWWEKNNSKSTYLHLGGTSGGPFLVRSCTPDVRLAMARVDFCGSQKGILCHGGSQSTIMLWTGTCTLSVSYRFCHSLRL